MNKKCFGKLDNTEIKVTEGEIRTLSVTDYDNGAGLLWSSSDESVVRIHKINGVDDGVVLNMLRQGSAVITAAADTGEKEACMVIVEPMVTVTDLSSLNYYFGDLHSHTGFSDGRGTPESAFLHTKEGGKAHFLAVTDHRYVTNRNWFLTLKHADMCTDESFVAIPSYEGGAYGESYEDDFGIKVNNNGEIVYFNTPEAYNFYETLAGGSYSVGMYAHPQEAGWPTEYIWNSYNSFNDITPEAEKLMKLVEVVNETSAYNLLHEYSYALALDKGWHVSPTGVSDTHCGEWTTRFSCRTVILAPQLSRAHIYDAMRNNRVYATENNNTRLTFKVNGIMMGQVLEPDTDTYDFEITVSDPDVNDENSRIRKIEIFSDYGQIVYSEEFNTHNASLNVRLSSKTARYFFVRAVNADNKRTWSSPVWTGRPADAVNLQNEKHARIDKSNWSIKWVSSQKDDTAKNIFDGDTRVGWECPEPDGEIIIDMGEQHNISAIGYYRHMIPYEDQAEVGKLLKDYEFYVSKDAEYFGLPVAKGTVKNYGSEHYVSFPETAGRYIKIKALSSLGGKTVTIGEISVYKAN